MNTILKSFISLVSSIALIIIIGTDYWLIYNQIFDPIVPTLLTAIIAAGLALLVYNLIPNQALKLTNIEENDISEENMESKKWKKKDLVDINNFDINNKSKKSAINLSKHKNSKINNSDVETI